MKFQYQIDFSNDGQSIISVINCWITTIYALNNKNYFKFFVEWENFDICQIGIWMLLEGFVKEENKSGSGMKVIENHRCVVDCELISIVV